MGSRNLTIGQGEHELAMVQTLVDSGYQGPIGILDHQPELDAEVALRQNLGGLQQLRRQLKARPAGEALSQSPIGSGLVPYYGADLVRQLVQSALQRGSADRGAAIFGSDQTACLSCHRLRHPRRGWLGGEVGPELEVVLKSRSPEHICRSLLWPDREIDSPYQLWQALTVDGSLHGGYRLDSAQDRLRLKELSSAEVIEIDLEEVEFLRPAGSPMPAELVSRLSWLQRSDLLRFLIDLQRSEGVSDAQLQVIEQSLGHGPAEFPLLKSPLDTQHWPRYVEHVNRDRIYDFYTKQAEYFRRQPVAPILLSAFPGLDGGVDGHWGNQTESTWADGRWNQTRLGSLQCGVFRHGELTVPRAICLQLGEPAELSCCFDPDTLTYRAWWRGGFVTFSDVRHGFLDGLRPVGGAVELIARSSLGDLVVGDVPRRYLGLYRAGNRVVFAYRLGQQIYLDAPWVENGQLVSEVALLERTRYGMW